MPDAQRRGHRSRQRPHQANALVVQQQEEWREILAGWETRNRYAVTNDEGTLLFQAGEVGTDWLSRNLLRAA